MKKDNQTTPYNPQEEFEKILFKGVFWRHRVRKGKRILAAVEAIGGDVQLGLSAPGSHLFDVRISLSTYNPVSHIWSKNHYAWKDKTPLKALFRAYKPAMVDYPELKRLVKERN